MTDERLSRIEERVAWLERHVGEQDKAMLEFAEENERLRKQLTILREKLPQQSGEDGDIPDQRPPHY